MNSFYSNNNPSSGAVYSFTPEALTLVGEARAAYVRQVYSYFSLGLLGGIVGALVGMETGILRMIMSMPLIGFLGMIGMLIFAQRSSSNPARAVPTMMGFTFVSGLVLSPTLFAIAHGYVPGAGPQTIFNALGLSGLVFGGLTAYTYISKKDFSYLQASLFIGLLLLIGVSIIGIFIGSSTLDLALSVITVIIFSGFVLVDTSIILRNAMSIPPTMAALKLYLDFLNIFVALLNIFGGGRRRS